MKIAALLFSIIATRKFVFLLVLCLRSFAMKLVQKIRCATFKSLTTENVVLFLLLKNK